MDGGQKDALHKQGQHFTKKPKPVLTSTLPEVCSPVQKLFMMKDEIMTQILLDTECNNATL